MLDADNLTLPFFCTFWTLVQATVRSFKGSKLCDVREFYMKDDQPAPGKKGARRGLAGSQGACMYRLGPDAACALRQALH